MHFDGVCLSVQHGYVPRVFRYQVIPCRFSMAERLLVTVQILKVYRVRQTIGDEPFKSAAFEIVELLGKSTDFVTTAVPKLENLLR
jgi:hypothetical protein